MLVIEGGDLEMDQEVMETLSYLPGLVLMDDVTNLVKHYKLEFSLHLCDSELLVHTVASSKQKLFGKAKIQEALSETLEPALPIGFGCE